MDLKSAVREGINRVSIQYKHVRFDYGLLAAFDRQTFDDRLMEVLNAHAAEGWELRGCFSDNGLHTHLIFARHTADDWEDVDSVLAKEAR
jgi:hypothetical protein